jgi:hypothetical protein
MSAEFNPTRGKQGPVFASISASCVLTSSRSMT